MFEMIAANNACKNKQYCWLNKAKCNKGAKERDKKLTGNESF